MLKIVKIVVPTVLCIVFLSGCGSSSQPNSTTLPQPQQQQYQPSESGGVYPSANSQSTGTQGTVTNSASEYYKQKAAEYAQQNVLRAQELQRKAEAQAQRVEEIRRKSFVDKFKY